MFYIIAMGYGLHLFSGGVISFINEAAVAIPDEGRSYQLLFAGSFLTCLFWVSSCIIHLWLFSWIIPSCILTGSGAGNVAMVCHWTGT